ncbi:GNAT family N-acetyltransferase [Streptomyces sp. WZ-12]|uniref:GNAT family N-acetyltransferase n=1 Tax=Streptomyces sp. WZ-12 TaxID=3030210 RepID=UPI0031595EB2
MGYRLRGAAWGKGRATEGALALVRRGLGELGYDRIVADTMFVNARSPAPNSPPCHTH